MNEAGAACRRVKAQLQQRVPVAALPGAPALAWSLLAAGLAIGGVGLEAPIRRALLIGCLLAAAGMAAQLRRDPVPRWAQAQLPLLLAVGLVAGGLRAEALQPPPVTPGPVRGATLQLQEPLAGDGRGAVAVLLRDDGQRAAKVLLAPGRYVEDAVKLRAPAGAQLQARGKLEPLQATARDSASTRGYLRHLRRQGVQSRLRADHLTWSGARRGGLLGQIDAAGSAAEARLHRLLGERRGALVAGMALGRAEQIGDADAALLRTSGLWHLVAASGGNIALVVALAMVVGWLAGLPDRARLLLAAVAVAAYVPLAGAGPSIQRAGVMGLVALAALWRGGEHRARDGLGCAAAATLLVSPSAWQDVGWQLSFVAAGALIFWAAPIVAVLIGAGIPRALAVVVACSVVATLATAPILLLTFGELSLIGLVANVLVAPLIGVIVWGGVLALALGPLAAVVAAPAGLAADAVLAVAAWGADRQFAMLDPRQTGAVIVGAALLAALRLPRRWIAATGAAALAATSLLTPQAPSAPRLIVLDVGQGSATLLQHGRDGMLFDAGPRGSGVAAALHRSGVRRLRAVILSHPAADHDGGAAEVLERFPVGVLLDGGSPGGGAGHAAAISAARAQRVPIAPLRAGQRLRVGELAVQVQWPTPAAARAPGDPNDRSGVLLADVGGVRVLLPGDAEGNVLRRLPGLRADALVLGHHGSRDADLPAVLRAVRPKVGVISVGAGNSYGHPAPETLAALRAAEVPVVRTDHAGAVTLARDGEALTIATNRPSRRD